MQLQQLCEVLQSIRTHPLCLLEVFVLPLNVTFGVYSDSGTVTQKDTGWSWEYIRCHFKMAVSHLKLPVTMVTGTSDQNRRTWVKRARVSPLRHFCVSGIIIFFQYHTDFFRYYFKVRTICDEYKRYWNNGICLSNQVYGNRRVRASKAPNTRIMVNSSLKNSIWNTSFSIITFSGMCSSQSLRI